MESSQPESEKGLTLFQHLRAREHRRYLDNCKDDIEEIKYEDGLSTFRISESTPTRGGGLLVYDAEKNDYDWLLTPPGTPLFPSLDQETANLNLLQKPPFTGSALPSKALKEPPLKSPSKLGSRGGTVARTILHANLSPQRAKVASPSRTSTSSSKARSPSPSPSSTGSHPSRRAFSPRRSVTTTGQSPARASQSRSKSSTSLVCQDNMSPLLAGRNGYSARRGPRRSLSPRLSPWEPVMEACSTDPPPNLRTSPSNRSIQRGNVEGSRKGSSFRIGGSSLETVLNCQRPKWRTMSADNIESYRLSTKPKPVSKDSPDGKCEIVARRKSNKGIGIAAISLSEDKQNGSHARRQAIASTLNKEAISDFANGKLMGRQTTTGKSLHNMFRPLMSNAPATLYHKAKPEPSNNEMSRAVSPSKSCKGSSKQHLKGSPEIHCRQQGQLSQRHDTSVDTGPRMVHYGLREADFRCRTHDCECTCEEASVTKPAKEIGTACAQIGNQTSVSDVQIGRESQTPLPAKPEAVVDMKNLNSVIQNKSLSYGTQAFPEHMYAGDDAQMPSVRLSRPQKLIEHGRVEEQILLSNKFHIFTGNNFNKDCMESYSERLPPQVFKNKSSGSQNGTRLPVRRQLSMGNADMSYGTWNKKNAESFDISTSDSYSCSESLDSSFLDNRTEKFSEDLSEVDSMSHTGFSNSSLSATIHSIHNLISLEKLSSDIGAEQDKVLHLMPRNYGGSSLDTSYFLRKHSDKKQGMQARSESMDSSHFLDRMYACRRRSLENVHSFIQALDLKQSQMLSAQPLVMDLHGQCPATRKNFHGEGGIVEASKSTSADMEETQDWDADESCKQLQPQTPSSPLKRNVTLEEATDTILFCSSIVHEIVYEAAALGEERSNMNSEEATKGCGLMCNVDRGRASPCWSWNPRRRLLPTNVVHKVNDLEPQTPVETVPSVDGRKGPSSPHIAEELQQKRGKKSGFCCFSP
ncbi:hypothetical protein GOP47_0029443 [Adiantum capillus-veneris]|nr:hypothetical protein GOP47_0029443 [Adiantum capillus-veneris]